MNTINISPICEPDDNRIHWRNVLFSVVLLILVGITCLLSGCANHYHQEAQAVNTAPLSGDLTQAQESALLAQSQLGGADGKAAVIQLYLNANPNYTPQHAK